MDETPNLDLPYIMAAQAQKHVTHNEAIRKLDAVVQLSAKDRDLTAPPVSPVDGDRYIVAASATGEWSGKDEQIAAYQDNAWMFYVPLEGWLCWVADEDKLLAWDSSTWSEVSSGSGSINPTALVGINATASDPDKLTVKSDAVLFSHDDVTPGTGDIRTKLNKAASANTASFVFQNNWSGRAEFGLAGDDDFHLKVSPDGNTWHEAMVVDQASGGVSMKFFDSQQMIIGADTVGTIVTPSTGGIVFVSLVHATHPQNLVTGIFIYDTGATPILTTIYTGTRLDNLGTTTLTGTTGIDGRASLAVDNGGNLYIEQRYADGPRQFALTFINSYKDLS